MNKKQIAKTYVLDKCKPSTKVTKVKQTAMVKYCQELFERQSPREGLTGNFQNWMKYINVGIMAHTGGVYIYGQYLQEFAEKNYWFGKGIYAIFEPYTGMLLYIGKTNDTFDSRWTSHRFDLALGRHNNELLQFKFNQGIPFEIEPGLYEDYGFRFQAIHIVTEETTNAEILELETYYIDQLKPIYNVSRPKNYHEEEWIDE